MSAEHTADEPPTDDTAHWVLSGPWLALHRFSLVALPIAVVAVVVVFGIQLAGPTPPPWWLPAVFVVVIGFLVHVQVRTATSVLVESDGTLVFGRSMLADRRMPAASVRSIGRPLLGGRRAGVRVRGASGSVPLAVGLPGVPGLVEIVARHDPEVRVGEL